MIFVTIAIISNITSANNRYIVIDFYYSAACPSCKPYVNIMKEVEENYTGKVIINWKNLAGPNNQDNYTEWSKHGFRTYPCAVINNETKVPKDNLTRENLDALLEQYIKKLNIDKSNNTYDIIHYNLFERPNPAAWMILIVVIVWIVSLIIFLYSLYKNKHKKEEPPDQKQ
ncbi:MAG: hypothetical protein QXS02_00445 [Candidatus Thermoplasmatota archaeon]